MRAVSKIIPQHSFISLSNHFNQSIISHLFSGWTLVSLRGNKPFEWKCFTLEFGKGNARWSLGRSWWCQISIFRFISQFSNRCKIPYYTVGSKKFETTLFLFAFLFFNLFVFNVVFQRAVLIYFYSWSQKWKLFIRVNLTYFVFWKTCKYLL